MKKAVGVAAIAAMVGTPVLAADMAPPPPPAPVYSWAGWYAGGNLGLALNDSQATVEPSGCFLTTCGGGPTDNPLRTFSNTLSNAAFTGGGQVGYNWQLNTIVAGLEADINYNGVNQNLAASPMLAAPLSENMAYSVSDRLDWFGTVRGRLGIAPFPAMLLYATGGFAYGQVSSSSAIAFSSTADTYAGSAVSTRIGWTAGAGAEWSFSPGWSIKGEYLYVDLGRISYADACITNCAVGNSYQTDLAVRQQIFRAGLNYRFNWGEMPRWLGAY